MSQQNVITIEFSGWLEIDADKVKFQSTEKDCPIISGTEYLKLLDAERDWYLLESLTDAMIQADELEYTDISIV